MYYVWCVCVCKTIRSACIKWLFLEIEKRNALSVGLQVMKMKPVKRTQYTHTNTNGHRSFGSDMTITTTISATPHIPHTTYICTPFPYIHLHFRSFLKHQTHYCTGYISFHARTYSHTHTYTHNVHTNTNMLHYAMVAVRG